MVSALADLDLKCSSSNQDTIAKIKLSSHFLMKHRSIEAFMLKRSEKIAKKQA